MIYNVSAVVFETSTYGHLFLGRVGFRMKKLCANFVERVFDIEYLQTMLSATIFPYFDTLNILFLWVFPFAMFELKNAS